MGCTRDNEFHIATADDSFNGTVRRPLIPNPNSSFSKHTNIFSTITPPCYNFIHSTNLLPLNHHLGNSTEQTRTHYVEQPLGSSRWNPTPEQLLALEEMYRRGTRTPSAEQIQHIAKQLRRFGKIEGKNVFYWFQNHKARERQKRRREIENINSEEKYHETDYNNQEKKDSGLRKTSNDVEQSKNWASSSNWSKHPEEFVPMHRSVAMADNGPHGWTQFDERELQQRKSTNNMVENMNATWQAMEFPCPHLANRIMNAKATASLPTKLLNISHDHDRNLMTSTSSTLTIKPYQERFSNVNVGYESINGSDQTTDHHQTLELFPLHSSDEHDRNSCSADDDDATKKGLIKAVPITAINTNNFSPNQYIEFLPLKN